jgi:transcription elongation factor Elf1
MTSGCPICGTNKFVLGDVTRDGVEAKCYDCGNLFSFGVDGSVERIRFNPARRH